MMDTFLIKATQLIMAFALLVIIHEFGHFLFARIFGVKVEKFYIFFDLGPNCSSGNRKNISEDSANRGI